MKWSKGETKVLKEFFPKEGGAVTKRLPGRTVAAVHHKAAALGLSYTGNYWSGQEVLFLYRNYKKLGPTACSKELAGRTPDACRNKAKELGLSYST